MKKTGKMQEKGFLYRRYTQEQGKRYGQTGSDTACNRERYGMSLNSNARPHKLGRAPLYLGAPALICRSGRSKPDFILLYYSFWGSRASGGFRVPSTVLAIFLDEFLGRDELNARILNVSAMNGLGVGMLTQQFQLGGKRADECFHTVAV